MNVHPWPHPRSTRPQRPTAGPRGGLRFTVAGALIVAISAAILVASPTPTSAIQIYSGIVDSSAQTGPRWASTLYTPSSTGPVTFTLRWTGGGDLATDARVASNNAWVAADVSTNNPKTMTATLNSGVTYRIALWARSGSGTFTMDAVGGSATTSTSTSTTTPAGETQLLQGVADATSLQGPRWTSVSYTPPISGSFVFRLTWTGNADLDFDVRTSSNGSWVADDTSASNPKTLSAVLTAGVAYRVAIWASSGVGTYRLTVTAPGGNPTSTTTSSSTTSTSTSTTSSSTTSTTSTSTTSTTTTTTVPSGTVDCGFTQVGSIATIQWVDNGGVHVLRRNGAWLASPGSGVDSYVDTAAPTNSTYELRTWTALGLVTRPCVKLGSPPPPPPPPPPPSGAGLVIQRGTVSATGAAPASIGTTITPSAAGPITVQLSWVGTANLNFEVTRASDGQLVASAATNQQPETATFSITPGTAYRVTTRAASGTAGFALSAAGLRNFPSAPAGAPNILIINVDDARPEALEVMPAVRRWFGDQGTRFTNASVSTPSCCPSRATTMSGQYDHNNGQRDQNTPSLDETDTIQRHLVDHGYLTGHTGKYLHYYDNSERAPYWDRWNYFKGGYFDVWVSRDGQVSQSDVYSTIMTFDRAIEYAEDFDSFDDNRPWYLQVTPIAPHSPSEPEPKYANAVVPPWVPAPSVGEADRSDKPPWVNWINQTQAAAAVQREQMQRTMMTVNERVDQLMTRLDELGELDNTIAIFTSDNGLFWGEHNLHSKFLPYYEAVHVPLLIRWPGHATPGAIDDRFVSNVDTLPTVLAAAGITPDHVVDGKNIFQAGFDRQVMLTEYWEDAANGNFVPDWTSIRTDTYMFAEYFDVNGAVVFREYYNLVADPYELVNLLQDGNPANDPNFAPLSAMIQTYRNCAGSTCP